MPITGLVIASGLPYSGTATSPAARLSTPARRVAPSSVGTEQPSIQLSVQSAPSRIGHLALPLNSATFRFAVGDVRTLSAFVRQTDEAFGAPASA